jgi:hypothetical protein
MTERSFALGKCEDVGRLIPASVGAVQALDRGVVRQNDRELCVLHLERVEHGSRAPPQLGSRHAFVRTFLHHEPHRHGRIV